MLEVFGADVFARAFGRVVIRAAVAVRPPHLRVGGLLSDRLAVDKEFHFVAVAEYADLVRRIGGPGVGHKDHRAGVNPILAQVDVRVALALHKVCAELRDAVDVHNAAVGEVRGIKPCIVGVLPIGIGAAPLLAAVEGHGLLEVVALDQHALVAAIKLRVRRLAGHTGGGGVAAVVPVAVLADDHRLVAVGGSVADDVCLRGADAHVVHIPVSPAAGIDAGIAVLRIFLMGNAMDFLCPRLVVAALVEARFPCDDGAVVAVHVEHVAHFLIGRILKAIGVDKLLPTGEAVDHRHAVFVARSVERRRVRVVGHPDEIEAPLLQAADLLKDRVVGLRVAEHARLRVEVRPVEFHKFIVDVAAVALPFHLADAVGGLEGIADRTAGQDRGAHGVELRRIDGPQARVFHHQLLGKRIAAARRDGDGILLCGNHRIVFVHDFRPDRGVFRLRPFVLHVGLRLDCGALLGDGGGCQEEPAACGLVLIDRIAHMQRVHRREVYIPVQAPEILEVRVGLAGVEGRVRARIDAHRDHVFLAIGHEIGQVDYKRGVAALMGANFLPIEPHFRGLHRRLKGDVELFALHFLRDGKVLAVPEDPEVLLVIVVRSVVDRAVRQVHIEPFAVLKIHRFRTGDVTLIVQPIVVEIDGFPAGFRCGARQCRGIAIVRPGRPCRNARPGKHRAEDHQRCQEAGRPLLPCCFHTSSPSIV